MAQTTLTIFAGDQLYKFVVFHFSLSIMIMNWNSYFVRLIGTFVGLIVGLLVWYIGERHYHISSFLQHVFI